LSIDDACEVMARPDLQRFCVSGSLEREPSWTRRDAFTAQSD